MSSGKPPEGWDEVPEEMLVATRGLRQMFLALIASGFTSAEAAMIIGHMMSASNFGGAVST